MRRLLVDARVRGMHRIREWCVWVTARPSL